MTRTPRSASPRVSAPSSRTRRRPAPPRDGVRWSRIVAAQTRIASGYYERDDVQLFLVDAILNDLQRH
jgi:hypothetical protein